MSLEDSMRKQGIPVTPAAQPAAPSPSIPEPGPAPSQPGPAKETIKVTAERIPEPPPPPPGEPSRAEKIAKVLAFADDTAVEIIMTAATGQGVKLSKELEAFAHLNEMELRRLARFAPAVYPWVNMIEEKLDAFPNVSLAIFGISFIFAVGSRLKTITEQVKAAKGQAGHADAPAAPAAAPGVPAPAFAPPGKPAAEPPKEKTVVPPRSDNPLAGLKI